MLARPDSEPLCPVLLASLALLPVDAAVAGELPRETAGELPADPAEPAAAALLSDRGGIVRFRQ